MLRMQRDTVDVVARGMTPKIIDIAESQLYLLSTEEQNMVRTLLERLRRWDGDMNPDSEAATIWNVWSYFYSARFFRDYFQDDIDSITIASVIPF